MDNQQLARVFLRFSGLCFLYYAVMELPEFFPYYRDYTTVWASKEDAALATQNLTRIVFRIGLQLLAGLVVLVRTDHIISFCLFGAWRARGEATSPAQDKNAEP